MELVVFKQYKPKLSLAVCDCVRDIALVCHSQGLIKDTYDKITQLNETTKDKADRLLNAIEKCIESDCSQYKTFLDILHKELPDGCKKTLCEMNKELLDRGMRSEKELNCKKDAEGLCLEQVNEREDTVSDVNLVLDRIKEPVRELFVKHSLELQVKDSKISELKVKVELELEKRKSLECRARLAEERLEKKRLECFAKDEEIKRLRMANDESSAKDEKMSLLPSVSEAKMVELETLRHHNISTNSVKHEPSFSTVDRSQKLDGSNK